MTAPLVFLLAGQSNMIRAGATLTRPTVSSDSVLSGTLRWSLTEDAGVTTTPCGPGLAFGRTVVAATERPVVLVGAALPGSRIADWQRGQDLYHEALWACQDAGQPVAAVLFAQGETDARSDGALDYLHADDWYLYFGAMVDALRHDLRQPTLPVLLGPLAQTTSALHGNWGRVQASQVRVCMPCLTFVCGGPVDLLPDGLHWADGSYGDQGRRYAAAYLGLAP